MTRAEAIEVLNDIDKMFRKFSDKERQALKIAIASLVIDEKYDLEFARSEEDIDLVGYRKTMMDSFDKRR